MKENYQSPENDEASYPFISKEQRKSNEIAVKKFIEMFKMFFLNQRTTEVIEYVENIKFIGSIGGVNLVTDENIINKCLVAVAASIVDENKTLEHGTAMFPLYNNVWNIGMIGSIWLDIKIDNECYRIGFYNETPPSFYIQNES